VVSSGVGHTGSPSRAAAKGVNNLRSAWHGLPVRQHEFVSDQLVDRGREALRAAGRSSSFRRGECLIAVGTHSKKVLLVESGLVKIVLSGVDGVETVANVLGSGALLGESGVLNAQPRSAQVLALRDGLVVHVAARTFLRLVDENIAVRHLVTRTWTDRQRDADHHHLCQAHDVPTRVGMTLLRWARSVGTATDSGLLVRGLSQRDVAQAVAASEKSVEAALTPLRASGLLATRRLAYLITKPEDLERLLAQPRRDQDSR
jgi:CRP/FNR family cyclic AMP-dependent transcriptional regulator